MDALDPRSRRRSGLARPRQRPVRTWRSKLFFPPPPRKTPPKIFEKKTDFLPPGAGGFRRATAPFSSPVEVLHRKRRDLSFFGILKILEWDK